MHCSNCGTSNLETASICANCGKPLTNAAPTYTPPPPPPSQASYIPPQAPGSAAYGTAPGAAPIPNYLIQSILVTLCCCLPLGIVAIIFSTQVNSKLAAGDTAGALDASAKAKLFCLIALGLGVVSLLISLAFGGLGVLQGINEGMANR